MNNQQSNQITHADAVMAELAKGRHISYREMIIELGINHPKDIILKLRKAGQPIERYRVNHANGKHHYNFYLA